MRSNHYVNFPLQEPANIQKVYSDKDVLLLLYAIFKGAKIKSIRISQTDFAADVTDVKFVRCYNPEDDTITLEMEEIKYVPSTAVQTTRTNNPTK